MGIVDGLPVAIPAALAAFSTVAVALLIPGQLRNMLVWPLGLAAAGLASYAVLRRRNITYPGTTFERNLCNVLILLGVLLWMGFNTLYAAQHVYTDRDPGTYAITGAWLVNHQGVHIDAPTVFGAVNNISPTSAGFSLANPQTNPHLDAQGAHLLPALLGLMGRIVGNVYMLHTQILFGGVALLALYGFARLLVRPYWALAATVAMGLSLPMIYFSRDTYSEPLAMAFTFGALALLWEAMVRGKIRLWLVAGLVAGAGVLTRVDGQLTIDALIGFAAIYTAFAQRSERTTRLRQSAALLCGMIVSSLVGWLDVSRLSQHYFRDTWKDIRVELIIGLMVLAAGVLVIAVAWRKKQLLKRLDLITISWRAKALAVAVIGSVLLMASRQFWYVGRATIGAVDAAGVPYLTTIRIYNELSVNWVVWYIGLGLGIAGLVGVAVLSHRLLTKKDILILPPFLVIIGTALFYLYDPHIYPDQMWASRRLLPVILPGVAVLGAIGLDWLYSKDGVAAIRKLLPKQNNLDVKTVVAVLATLAVITPLFESGPFLSISEAAWLSPVVDMCKALPKSAAVLWVGVGRTQLVEPTEAYCNTPSEGYGRLFVYTDKPSRQELAQAARNARANGYQPIVGTFVDNADLVGGADQLTPVASYTYQRLERSYTYPPHAIETIQNSILLGRIDNNGNVHPL